MATISAPGPLMFITEMLMEFGPTHMSLPQLHHLREHKIFRAMENLTRAQFPVRWNYKWDVLTLMTCLLFHSQNNSFLKTILTKIMTIGKKYFRLLNVP